MDYWSKRYVSYLPKDCASAELATLLGDETVLSMIGDFLGASSSIERRFVS